MLRMIDRDLIEMLDFNRDFMPIFSDIEKCFQRLDALEIRRVVGDRLVDHLEDKFIRVVISTFQHLEK